MKSKLRMISLGAALVIGTPLLLPVPPLSQLSVIYKTFAFLHFSSDNRSYFTTRNPRALFHVSCHSKAVS